MNNIDFEVIVKLNNGNAVGTSYETNGLFELDLNNRKCKYEQMIPNEAPLGNRLYVSGVLSGQKVYFVPATAKEIAIYNTIDKTISKLPFNTTENGNYNAKKNFSGAVCFDHYIFMVPWTYPAVIRIDTNDDSIDYFDEWVTEEPFDFRKSIYVEENNFFIVSAINNIMLQFDMQYCKGIVHHVGKADCGYWSICKAHNKLWFSPVSDGPIISWDMTTNEAVEYSEYPKGFQGKGFCFTKNYLIKERLYFVSALGNMSVFLDLNNGSIEKCDVEELNNNDITACMHQTEDKLYLKVTQYEKTKNICLNMNDNSIIMLPNWSISNEQEFVKSLMDILRKSGVILNESIRFNLEDFLKGI